VLEAVHELRVHPGSSPADPFFDDWLHDFLILTSAPVCAAGALRHTRDGRAWMIELHRWLDGIVIVLVLAAPMVALVLDPVLRRAPPDLLGQIVTLAYPFGDLVLLGTLLGALPMMSWRIDASWLLLGVGLICLTVGDAAYAGAALDDAYHNGPFDFLWSAGSVAIAWAAWFPNAETRPPSEVFGWRAMKRLSTMVTSSADPGHHTRAEPVDRPADDRGSKMTCNGSRAFVELKADFAYLTKRARVCDESSRQGCGPDRHRGGNGLGHTGPAESPARLLAQPGQIALRRSGRALVRRGDPDHPICALGHVRAAGP